VGAGVGEGLRLRLRLRLRTEEGQAGAVCTSRLCFFGKPNSFCVTCKGR